MATKSSVVSGMGLGLSLIQALVESIKYVDGGDDDVHFLSTPEADCLWWHFALSVRAFRASMKAIVSRVDVDYSLDLKTAIDSGKYGEGDTHLEENDRRSAGAASGRKEFRLFHFDHEVTAQEVADEMTNEKCRPADLRELLAFGAINCRLHEWFSIIALGAIGPARYGLPSPETVIGIVGYRIPVVGRQLLRHGLDRKFRKHDRFLAIKGK